MKKLLGVAVVGSLLVGGIVLAKGTGKASTPEGKMCTKLADVCPVKEKTVSSFDTCVEKMEDLRKVSGQASFDRSERCVAESTSCAAAAGCLTGGIGMGAVGEYMKGFGTALSK